MNVSDQKEKTSLVRPRLATCFMAHLAYLHAIFSQPLLAPELETMACWQSLAAGNLTAAQSLREALCDIEATAPVA
jgi:hypothetical protein